MKFTFDIIIDSDLLLLYNKNNIDLQKLPINQLDHKTPSTQNETLIFNH